MWGSVRAAIPCVRRILPSALDCTLLMGTLRQWMSSCPRPRGSNLPRFRNTSSESSRFGAIWSVLRGLAAARAVPGFRDHPLQGDWQGYRAIRLSDAYRAIYIVRGEASVDAVYVEEVNKHDY